MAFAETAELVTRLTLDDRLSKGIANARANVRKLDADTKLLQSGLGKIGKGVGVGIKNSAILAAAGIGVLTLAVKGGLDELRELERATKGTAAILKNVGNVSGQTAESVRQLAEKYEDLTTIDDKVVQSGANILLTFRKIGPQAFEPALRSALDLAAAIGGDDPDAALAGASKALGMALQDPIRYLGRLERTAGPFDAAVKKRILALAKEGKAAEAQALILAELDKKYKGLAQAKFGTGIEADFRRLNDAIGDAKRTLVEGLLPGLATAAQGIAAALKDPATLRAIREFGATLASFLTKENVAGAIQAIGDVLPSVLAGLKTALAIGKQAVDIFRSLPPELQKALVVALAANKLTGGLVASGIADLAKFALGSLKTITAGSVTLIAGSVTGGGAGAPGGVVGGAGGTAGKVLGAVSIIGSVFLAGASIAALGQTMIDVQDSINRSREALREKTDAFTAPGAQDLGSLVRALDGIEQNTDGVEGVLLQTFGAVTGARDEVNRTKESLRQAILAQTERELPALTGAIRSQQGAVVGALGILGIKTQQAGQASANATATGAAKFAGQLGILSGITKSGLGRIALATEAGKVIRLANTIRQTINTIISGRVADTQTKTYYYTGAERFGKPG